MTHSVLHSVSFPFFFFILTNKRLSSIWSSPVETARIEFLLTFLKFPFFKGFGGKTFIGNLQKLNEWLNTSNKL